jgi:hypothetical protein
MSVQDDAPDPFLHLLLHLNFEIVFLLQHIVSFVPLRVDVRKVVLVLKSLFNVLLLKNSVESLVPHLVIQKRVVREEMEEAVQVFLKLI